MPPDTPDASEDAARAYRALGDEFSMAVILMDPSLTIRWANPAAASVLGWPEDQIVGRNGAELIHPDDLGNFAPMVGEMAALMENLEGTPTPSAPVELPCRTLRADGGWNAMSVTGRMLGTDGDMLAVVRPSAERHAFAEVLDGLGQAAPFEEILMALVVLLEAQFASGKAWLVHDADGAPRVIGFNDDPVPFDRSNVLSELRLIEWEERSVVVDGNLWVVPVMSVESDRVFGAFVMPAMRAEGPSPWDELVAHRTGNLCAVVFTRDLRDRLLEVAATTDYLTGVLNRREFERILVRDSADAMPITLFLLDLDDFKVVNDDFGHLAGDAVLANVARRLLRTVRAGDRVGRLGGDEFVISCPGLVDGDVEATRERIASVVEEPVAFGGRRLKVTASVGVGRAFTNEQLETLIKRSDADMFAHKRSPKDNPVPKDG